MHTVKSLDSNFRHVALALCAIRTTVAHGRPIHGLFHVGRFATVVAVASTGRIGSGSLRETFIDVSSVKGTRERTLGPSYGLYRWQTLGSEPG
jgi:hypothetical protein